MTPVICRCELLLTQVQQAGDVNGTFNLPPEEQELVFMGERCRDTASLADYGVSEHWIVQVQLPLHFDICSSDLRFIGAKNSGVRHYESIA